VANNAGLLAHFARKGGVKLHGRGHHQDRAQRRTQLVTERGEKLVLRFVRVLRGFLRGQEFVLEMTALSHPDQNAIVLRATVSLRSPGVNEKRDLFATLSPERHVNFLHFALQFQERKEVGLVKDTAAGRKNFLQMPSAQLLARVAEQAAEGRIDGDDVTVIGERQDTAGRIVERRFVHADIAGTGRVDRVAR
jgi:hypothetical protein